MAVEANDLMLFARVVDSGSFSRAAEMVGLPKSTVSRRISFLENALGERLLQRLGELCAGAADIEEDGDVAMAEIAGPAQEALGAAIRSLGPEAVLGALPLNLQEVSEC